MFQRIEPCWNAKLARLQGRIPRMAAERAAATDPDVLERLVSQLESLRHQAQWMESTITEIVISEAQNEVRDFQKWGFDIIPHRVVMKTGVETVDGKRVAVEDAFKDPKHPFRIAIVCAMWLTCFDVECLGTLYIDKPRKAHNLMQAIARANRVFPGKDCGVIVDYNGMLKSLREALAQYALGDEVGDGGDVISSMNDVGTRIGLWVSACEVLIRSDADNIDKPLVQEAIGAVELSRPRLTQKRFIVQHRGHRYKVALPARIYDDMYRTRNAFPHGNPVEPLDLFGLGGLLSEHAWWTWLLLSTIWRLELS